MQAYIDDSGNHKDSPVFILAGFVASVENWKNFSIEWKGVLDQSPAINYFKMQEAAGCTGQFYQWGDDRRNERLNALIGVIRKHVFIGLTSIVPMNSYNHVFGDKVAKGMDNPYFLSFYRVMMAMMKFQEQFGLAEKVDFVFDQTSSEKTAMKGWEHFVKHAPSGIAALIGEKPLHRDDKNLLPLQAADLLAWKTRRFYHDQQVGQPDSWQWESFEPIKVWADFWTGKSMQQFYDRMQKFNGEIGQVFPYENKLPKKKR